MNKIIVGVGAGVAVGFLLGYVSVSSNLHTAHNNHSNHEHHAHAQMTVSGDTPAPSLSVAAIPDTKDGFNLHVMTEHFRFSPEGVNGNVLQNEGHAHIYINDDKIARLYGDWFHLGADLFSPGSNEIKVTLNANDHSEWAVAGESISQTVTVTK